MATVECPYCNKKQDIELDDRYNQDELYQDECGNCGKYFAFNVCIDISLTSRIADCLNGDEHQWKPYEMPNGSGLYLQCKTCGEIERQQ